MIKRILFFTITLFVITLPVTGIWSLSLSSARDWPVESQAVPGGTASGLAQATGINHYFRSLQFLINGHESFGPFT
ncbi:MAG: hypothetical protein R3208_11495 [Ketobacteraceae bacterium]|nr:hypothetical protein [Ketobacteraceae bacterium]